MHEKRLKNVTDYINFLKMPMYNKSTDKNIAKITANSQ